MCIATTWILLELLKKFAPARVLFGGKVCLAITGAVLLASESLLTLGVFVWVVLSGWFAVLIASWDGKFYRAIFVLLLGAQLVPLFYYKYWGFFFNDVLGLEVRVPSVLIPMGLSFYTFQTVAFCVDTRKGSLRVPAFIDFLNFSSFHAQIVAGPIERRDHLLPQISAFEYRIRLPAVEAAVSWIVLGLFYKMVLADNLGALMPRLRINEANAWQVWFECFAFGFRIYFDFAGYSFIAIGLGLLFGVNLTLNFRSPYWSVNLKQFWRRWHITLSSWLRDYVYLPLGGRRGGYWQMNVLIVFLVSGIWHGAGWGFLIWGAVHGLGVVFCSRARSFELPAWLSWLVTFVCVTAAWLFFLERDPDLLLKKSFALVLPGAYSLDRLAAFPMAFPSPAELVTFAMVLGLGALSLAFEGMEIRRGIEPYRWLRCFPSLVTMVILIVMLSPMEDSSFIYFNF